MANGTNYGTMPIWDTSLVTDMSGYISGLQVEYLVGYNSAATSWLPSYASAENSAKSASTDSVENGAILASDWSYDTTNGYTQMSTTGMIIWGYENDGIMASLDSTDGQSLSYDVWIKVSDSSSWNAETANSPRGWLLSYDTYWGPAITLKDDRVNNGGVGSTPGDDGSNPSIAPGYYGSSTFLSKFGPSGTVSPSKDGWDHIIGYWENSNNVIKHGVYINGYLIEQADSTVHPAFDTSDVQLVLGNYVPHAISSDHNTKGLSVYGFRVWHKKIDQVFALQLYNAGHTASALETFVGLANRASFNGDISNWDTSRVTNMAGMFHEASAFNANISSWNTNLVTDMNAMFYNALAFDKDISGWTGAAASSAQINIFYGANAFQTKFTCYDSVTGPVNSCSLKAPERYPTVALTSASSNGYTVTSSSSYADFAGFYNWRLYNRVVGGNDGWHTPHSLWSNSGATYNGAQSIGSYVGEWNKIKFPAQFVLQYLIITARPGYPTQAPKEWSIIGSNDDLNWTLLKKIKTLLRKYHNLV